MISRHFMSILMVLGLCGAAYISKPPFQWIHLALAIFVLIVLVPVGSILDEKNSRGELQ